MLVSLSWILGRASGVRPTRLPALIFRTPQQLTRSRSALAQALVGDDGIAASEGDAPLPFQDGLLLVDGHALGYRMFFALQNTGMTTHQGEETHALHGFCLKLLDLHRMWPNHRMLICFDRPGPIAFRTNELAEYKANRPAMPVQLRHQISAMVEASELLGATPLSADGFEADDLIATCVQAARRQGFQEVVIVASDKDLLQLVSEGPDDSTCVSLWDDRKKMRLQAKDVVAKHGVRPGLMGDLLALMGDASDNVPGVPGVGAKSAATLLNEHGSLEGVLGAAQDDAKPNKRTMALVEHAQVARRARRLVELNTDAPLDAVVLRGAPFQIDENGLVEFLERWELNTVLRSIQKRRRELQQGGPPPVPAAPQERPAQFAPGERARAAAKAKEQANAASLVKANKVAKAKTKAKAGKEAAKAAAKAATEAKKLATAQRKEATSMQKAVAKAQREFEKADAKAAKAEAAAESKAERAAKLLADAEAAAEALQPPDDAPPEPGNMA